MVLTLVSAKSVCIGTPLQTGRISSKKNFVRSRVVAPRAGYGEEGKYFDLSDLENTTGSWDMYGQEDEKRYPSLQAEFFERAGSAVNRRESIFAFLAIGGPAALLVWGGKGTKDISLPIANGPQTSGESGKGGKFGRL
eukprot:TRINITY_DN95381_c0_g1_i1.p2 TRINITY_DN95381_c0_g1~~TRINITY_DN95381_c0_g1_i1.p2  ORF type:complete len:138 (-),score=26.24 TRINITY_DN95381_c0_g1_i1:180-593(-)